MKVVLTKSVMFSAGIACAISLVADASAEIVANFDDGAGSTLVDQYPGVAGDGWSTAWTLTSDASAAVNNASPLNGGGNYLTVNTTSANARGVKRTYTTFDDIDLTQEHIIAFDWRFEGNIAQFNTDGDRPYIADGSTGSLGESAATAFHIRAHGDDRGTANGGEWAVYNGGQDDAASIDDNLWVNTGMSFEDDVVYSFTIVVDPQSRTYDVTIDNGTTDVTVNDMGFWSSTNSVAGTLNFLSRKGASADDLSFSVDSISITVPEPASAALFGIGTLMILARSSKH